MDADSHDFFDGGLVRHSEADLAEAAERAAREAEFEDLYRTEIEPLVRFVKRATPADMHEATDAAQEAFLEYWQTSAIITNPPAWLRTVALRKFLRSSPKERLADKPLDTLELLTPEALLEVRDESNLVLRILDQLPPMQRQVLAMYKDGITIAEIAEALNCTPEAVRQNLCRARHTLKRWLKRNSGEDVE